MSNPATQAGTPAKSLRRGKKLVFVLLVVLIPLCFAELVCAVYLNFLSRNPRTLAARNIPSHIYDAYRNHALGPDWSSGGRVHNRQGFRRSTDVSVTKPANGYRIFLMGGSAAYGLDSAPHFPRAVITNKQTVDYKLERLLQPIFPGMHVEVINAAVTGYWMHHHLIYLHQTILDYDPDLIILLDGINDYYHTLPQHRQFDSYQLSMTLRTAELNHPTPLTALQALLGWGKQHSHAAFVMNEVAGWFLRWNRVPEDPCNLESVRPENLNEGYLERYRAISGRTWVRTMRSVLATLKDERVDAITTLQPELIFTQSKGSSALDNQLRDIEVGLRPAFYKEKKEFLKPVAVSLAKRTAEEFGATFVDLTDVFDSHDQYFIDYCHLSEEGARRLAEVLLPCVENEIRRGKSCRHEGQAPKTLAEAR